MIGELLDYDIISKDVSVWFLSHHVEDPYFIKECKYIEEDEEWQSFNKEIEFFGVNVSNDPDTAIEEMKSTRTESENVENFRTISINIGIKNPDKVQFCSLVDDLINNDTFRTGWQKFITVETKKDMSYAKIKICINPYDCYINKKFPLTRDNKAILANDISVIINNNYQYERKAKNDFSR